MPVRDDYLLRMVEQVFQLLRRIVRRQSELELPAALAEVGESIRAVLGPAAEVAERLDAATAVPLIADPTRAVLWARLLAARAELLAEAGDPAAAAAGRRAREVAGAARDLARTGPPLPPDLADALEDAQRIAEGIR